ncbi:hypothetical protein ALP29_200281 [Pseudomonas syringae pv. avii]|uniref:Uncharacterized protein n=1 Tax=Pseudomonas syringae pv. avii TaxID=663959 RepID=A0A3M5W0Y7_PSESX|nr:hypothetical protein ALP29_200281 [Pseudomonas syringae pv. avii]
MFAVELFINVVVIHQRYAGVLPDQIQLSTFLRATRQAAAQAAGDLNVITLCTQVLRSEFRQNGLFGEHPRSDAQQRLIRRLGKCRKQQGKA